MRIARPGVRRTFLLILAAALAVTACDDGVAPGPGGLPAGLGMSFNVIGQAASIADVFDKADNLEVTVAVQGREPVTRTFPITAGQSTIEARLQLTLDEATATAQVHVELKKGPDPLFAGSRSVTLEQGGQQQLEVDLSAVAARLLVPSRVDVDVLGQPVTLPGEVGFATGDPIPGAQMLWSSSETGIQVTQDGRLTAMRNGTYPVVATGGGLSETVIVDVAAEPTSVEFVAGHHQTALSGHTVPESPVVLVTHGSVPMDGIDVTFTADMDGTVSHSVVPTDDQGRALLPEWTLGAEGENTLTATVGGLPPATLIAVAGDPCQVRIPMQFNETVRGTYDMERDCVRNLHARDRYVLTLTEETTLTVTLESGATNARFQSWTGDIQDQATDGVPSGDFILAAVVSEHGPARGEHILAPGEYVIEAMATAEGTYTLSTAPLSEPQQGCGMSSAVVKGVVAEGQITSADCEDELDQEPEVVRWLDSYTYHSRGIQTITVTVQAAMPTRFTHWAGGEIQHAFHDLAAGEAHTFTITTQGGYNSFVLISENHQGTGAYSMSFSAAQGTSAARAPLVQASGAAGPAPPIPPGIR